MRKTNNTHKAIAVAYCPTNDVRLQIVLRAVASLTALVIAVYLAFALHRAPNAAAAIADYFNLIISLGLATWAAWSGFYNWFRQR
jgi:hypothetical protein